MTIKLAISKGGEGATKSRDDLSRIEKSAQSAKQGGADLLLFPELDWGGYQSAAHIRASAISVDALQVELGKIAKKEGIDLVLGYPEKAEERGQNGEHLLYNSLIWISAQGDIIANYRKIHLWGDLETSVFTHGQDLPPVVSRFGMNFGLLICFDIDQPVPALDLGFRGAQAILVSSATSHNYKIVPQHLIATRAYENSVFVAYANRFDQLGKHRFAGGSLIASPAGNVLANLPLAHQAIPETEGPEIEKDLIYADLNIDEFKEYLSQHPYRALFRSDIYE